MQRKREGQGFSRTTCGWHGLCHCWIPSYIPSCSIHAWFIKSSFASRRKSEATPASWMESNSCWSFLHNLIQPETDSKSNWAEMSWIENGNMCGICQHAPMISKWWLNWWKPLTSSCKMGIICSHQEPLNKVAPSPKSRTLLIPFWNVFGRKTLSYPNPINPSPILWIQLGLKGLSRAQWGSNQKTINLEI